jgi:hypothetical protein
MAIVIEGFAANDATDLVSAVNAYLATLVNPIINAIEVAAFESARTLGRSYGCIVTSQTGGATIATPWQLTIYEEVTAPAVAADAAAFVAANPAAFVAAPKLRTWYYNRGAMAAKWAAIVVANATGGASANWQPT